MRALRRNYHALGWLAAIFIIAAFCFCSCSTQDAIIGNGVGWVNFSVSVDQNNTVPPTQDFALTMSTIDGKYQNTWDKYSDFQAYESYSIGQYYAKCFSGDSSAEGYGCPYYLGEALFDIKSGEITNVPIKCSLRQSVVYLNYDDSPSLYGSISNVYVHSDKNGYVEGKPQTQSPLLVMPGQTTVYVTVKDDNGKSVTVRPNLSVTTTPSNSYAINASIAENALSVSLGENSTSISLVDIFSGESPYIECEGFSPDQILNITEGYPPATPVVMRAKGHNITKAYLTISANKNSIPGLPYETDLLTGYKDLFAQGLTLTTGSDEITVDFTKILENQNVNVNTDLTFTLIVEDNLGRTSLPTSLKAYIQSVDFYSPQSTDAIIGKDITTISFLSNTDKVEAQDFKAHILNNDGDEVSDATILASKINNNTGEVSLEVMVPEGNQPVPVAIDYAGVRKFVIDVNRAVPKYGILVDAFASSAIILIKNDDAKTQQSITRLASVTANGSPVRIVNRYIETGVIHISGLSPQKKYEISTVVTESGFTPVAEITTETAFDVPSGDFEDGVPSIKYKGLPQGGQYSATAFPIFNMQNYLDIDLWWPDKDWASVNAKTFCSTADNNNTWFRMPSSELDFTQSVSGSKSIKISSVGWSLVSSEIAPYCQDNNKYVPYNENAPAMAHRSAGRLFLGSYTFDPQTMQETYSLGVPFKSRPSSLNGFYKYLPDDSDPSDTGTVEIVLINDDGENPVILAKGSQSLTYSPDFIAFNIPLEYDAIGVKATTLQIMFASSKHKGTIEEEDINVPLSPYYEQGAFLGSTLWIDNLSFSY